MYAIMGKGIRVFQEDVKKYALIKLYFNVQEQANAQNVLFLWKFLVTNQDHHLILNAILQLHFLSTIQPSKYPAILIK